MKSNKTQKQETHNRPTHIAYSVRQIDDKRSTWQPIGVAWAHSDNKGLTVALNVQPLDGRITLRVNEDKKEQQS